LVWDDFIGFQVNYFLPNCMAEADPVSARQKIFSDMITKLIVSFFARFAAKTPAG